MIQENTFIPCFKKLLNRWNFSKLLICHRHYPKNIKPYNRLKLEEPLKSVIEQYYVDIMNIFEQTNIGLVSVEYDLSTDDILS